ncbi:acyl-[ACP]--phospholipid O-acyltransferase [Sulfurospirillum arcachonense]|uniref:acyl-[ACP]--phospholipid O-acyltransferase n=1 Tax=Sulfurospirillum arcachonense TaxID=57666 RepID=UPI00046A393A|nr:acyl-[ACP]--phospholipid O-acyltransferase [Sulfurospirillum arcachonense]
MKALFSYRGFASYILIVFLNAMTDLGHKIIIQNTVFKSFDGHEQVIYTAIVNGLVLLPFIMLFTPSGFLSDKFSKPRVIQISALVAIVIACAITVSYHLGAFWLSFALTFLLAAQSALYSPAKYGYIKELVGKENLASANGMVQAVTIVAILIGAVLYSVIFEYFFVEGMKNPNDIITMMAPMGYILIGATLLEAWFSFKLAPKASSSPSLSFDRKKYFKALYLKENLKTLLRTEAIWLSVIGLGLFWSVSQVVFALFGTLLEQKAGVENTVVAQGLMALGGLGIVVGSLYHSKISKHYIETGVIPLGAAGMALSLFWLSGTSSPIIFGLLFFLFGFCGGIFIIPLNALIQFYAKENDLGRVLAANNFVQTLMMLVFLGFTIIWSLYTFPIELLFSFLGIIVVVGSLYTIIKLPQLLVRFIIYRLANLRYNIKVSGLDNLPSNGGVLLLGNHISWLDWAIVQIASPRRVRFVMERNIYEKWYLKIFLDFFGVIPISSRASRSAFKTIGEYLDKGEVVALFPEGAISRNGHLGEFKGGFEKIVTTNEYTIVPFFLKGLWGSRFSFASNKMKQGTAALNRDVTFAFGSPMPMDTDRVKLKEAINGISVDSWNEYINVLEPVQHLWIDRAKMLGSEMSVADSSGGTLSHTKLIASVLSFHSLLHVKVKNEQNVGVILPASAGNVIANMALLVQGKTVVNLNYTASKEAFLHALNIAEVKTVVTSSKFLTKLKAKGFDIEALLQNVNVLIMEDMKEKISKSGFIFNLLLAKFMPSALIKALYFKSVCMEETAAILFSSGSEGLPKGIELSHKNLVGNIKQSVSILNPDANDVIVGSLPPFHSFGFTITTLMPLVEGIPLVCHPDPTDAVGMGKVVATHQATILCATSTFLRLYNRNRKLHPLMFESLRLIIAGAEKLNPDVRDGFKVKFGKDVLEGYGATETTPVACVNIPDVLNPRYWTVQEGKKQGTVGMALPGTRIRIVNPENYQDVPNGEEGLILIGGTQIMKGYLKDEAKTADAILEENGVRWYKSGDKGKLDADGFLSILGRYSRFAKIGGEMISLSEVEEKMTELVNDESFECAVSAFADEKKGEKIVMIFTTTKEIQDLKKLFLDADINPLMIPSNFLHVEEIPKLGTGKNDFSAIKKVTQEKLSEDVK